MPIHSDQTNGVSVRRHCMQSLLRSAICGEPSDCLGVLAGSDNIMDTTIDVTKNMLYSASSTHSLLTGHNNPLRHQERVAMGIYHHIRADKSSLKALKKLYHSTFGEEPALLLILDDDHKGRIDAHLYAGNDIDQRISLDMIEDGPLYPAVMTR